MIRISSGILRGIEIFPPKNNVTRPSHSKLRQAVFNVLRTAVDFESSVVIDLFSGTGALGIEAISQGAKNAWFVESDLQACQILKKNIERIKDAFSKQNILMPETHVLNAPVSDVYARLPEATLIFADPPYDRGAFHELVLLEAKNPRLVAGGLLVFESSKKEIIEIEQDLEKNGLFNLKNLKIYGDSAVHYFVKL